LENIEKASDKSLYVLFIDFKKAFDSIKWSSIAAVLKAYSVPDKLVKAVMSLYFGANAKVCTSDGISDAFFLSSGVLQGDTLAPFLFILVMDYIMRFAIPDDSLGFQYIQRLSRRFPAKSLADLLFADDIALLSDNLVNIQSMLDSVIRYALLVGLQINVKKTQWLVVGKDSNTLDSLYVNNIPLEKVSDYKYLGVYIRNSSKEFSTRKAQAWEAAKRLKKLWISRTLSHNMKIRVFISCVESVLLYAAETWTLTKTLEKRLDGAYTRLLRYALNISWKDKITNTVVYKGVSPVSTRLRERRLTFAGHCFRAGQSAPQPIMDLILWRYKGNLSRGAANKRTYVKMLCNDRGLSFKVKDIDESIVSLKREMRDRKMWRSVIYQ
jgi:sorting nexin-29